MKKEKYLIYREAYKMIDVNMHSGTGTLAGECIQTIKADSIEEAKKYANSLITDNEKN